MRVLSVGWEAGGGGVEVASLHDADSLASYDVVLIDPLSIPDLWVPFVPPGRDGIRRLIPGHDQGLSRALDNLFAIRRREIEGLLGAGGILVVKVRAPGEPVEISSPGGAIRTIDAYTFLPSLSLTRERQFLAFPRGIKFIPRKGRDVHGLDYLHPLAPYLSAVKRYEAVIVSPYGLNLADFGRVLLRNRIGDVLAWEVRHREGRIVFLPPTELTPAKETELLLKGLASLMEAPLSEGEIPGWLKGYALPGEKELIEELSELEAEERRIAERKSELEGKLREAFILKGLLFPAGTVGLRRAAARAFGTLGFSVEDDEFDPGNLRISSREGRAVARVAWAPEGPVTTGAYRPLLLALDHLRIELGEDFHGILVVAADTLREPGHRGPRFTDPLRRACEEHGIGLVTGEELFGAVRAVLSGVDPAPVRRSLLAAIGPWRWKG